MKVKYKNIVCSISLDSANMFVHLHSAQVILSLSQGINSHFTFCVFFLLFFLKGEYLMGEVGGLVIIT